jgi:hypothetical protein
MKFELETKREREREECELAQWNGVVEIINFELEETGLEKKRGNPHDTDMSSVAFIFF